MPRNVSLNSETKKYGSRWELAPVSRSRCMPSGDSGLFGGATSRYPTRGSRPRTTASPIRISGWWTGSTWGFLSMPTYLRTNRPGCSRLPRGVPSIACWFRKSRFARSCLFPFLRRVPSGVAAVIIEQGSSTVLNGTQGGLSQISPSSGRTGLLPYVA
jgi:hypothetical protein